MKDWQKVFLSAAIAGVINVSPYYAGAQGSNKAEITKTAITEKEVSNPPYTLQAKKNNPVNKYAIIVIGGGDDPSLKSDDPTLKNYFWLNGTYVFNYLQELGFKTYVFYADGKPDFSEKINRKTIRYLKRHKFKGRARKHEASIENLEAIINKLAKRINSNDVFVLSISAHGKPTYLELEEGLDTLKQGKLNKLLKKIKPGFGLLYVDACHSGAFIDKLNLDNYIAIAATEGRTAWADRNFSSDRYFFENLLSPKSDMNIDGKITIKEAWEKTKEEAGAYLNRLKENELKKDSPDKLEGVSVVPVMKIGKNVSDGFYLFDSLYFKK